MFLKGGSEASDESIEASPSLAERAGAWSWRVRMTKERAKLSVDFGFPELVKVAEEFQDVGPAAAGERERGAVVAEVLAKSIPVTALLVFIAAKSGWRSGGRGGRGGGGGCRRACVDGGCGGGHGGDGKVCREIWG